VVTLSGPEAYAAASAVLDPEIPVVTIEDLGILRGVELRDDGVVTVTITPTYSGCPAMDAIRADVASALAAKGFDRVEVLTVLSPAWTTDWISAAGLARLQAYGIAPPAPVRSTRPDGPVSLALTVRCPQCGALGAREISRFGSTACKSLWVCTSCAEPFDHFKAV
jgi:ring-1,2-phenylacetyl-CoA epoxidase subunit PaaD